MLHRRASGALAVAFCVGCGAPTASVALEPGVHVDPGSPAAKQYGVPLWVLRGDASGHQSPEGIPPPPLFGVGIGPSGSRGSVRSGGGPAGGAGGRAPRARGQAGGGTGRAGANGGGPGRGTTATGAGALSAATIAQLTHEGSSAPQVGLIVGGVLVGGLVLGGAFALGRRALAR